MSMTAFDLEQDIMKCWSVTDDIGEIAADLAEGHMTAEEAARALEAYQQVYSRRFERCFSRFEQFNREVWELRQSTAEDLDGFTPSLKNRGKMSKNKSRNFLIKETS